VAGCSSRTKTRQAIAAPVLRHRLKTNFNADAEGINADEIVRRLIAHVTPPAEQDPAGGKLADVIRPQAAG
jgi:MoxR-like ATPase